MQPYCRNNSNCTLREVCCAPREKEHKKDKNCCGNNCNCWQDFFPCPDFNNFGQSNCNDPKPPKCNEHSCNNNCCSLPPPVCPPQNPYLFLTIFPNNCLMFGVSFCKNNNSKNCFKM